MRTIYRPHPAAEIAEAMIQRAEYDHMRRTSIYRSLYAPALEVIHDPADHPGYDDVILTRSHAVDTSYAPATVAYLNRLYGVRS